MLVQPTQDEGASSHRPSEAQPTPSPAPTSEVPNEPQTNSSPAQTSEVPIEQQTDLSPRPSPTPIIPDSIPETSGENVHSKDSKQSFSKKHRVHKESVSKQGRKVAKGESSVQRDPLFDTIPEDSVDHMETENAQDEGRTREMVDEDKEIDEIRLSTEDVLSTDKEGVSTDKEKVSTDRPIHKEGTEEHNEGAEEQREGTEEKVESTDGQRKSIEDQTEEEIAAQATQTPTQTYTSTVFGDDETIAKVLLNMSQAKAVSREKEKGVELKDIEEADNLRPTTKKITLNSKALPKDRSQSKGLRPKERLLAEKLQEQRKRAIYNRRKSKVPTDTIAAQRRFLTQQRSEAIRNKPPTKNQLRNQMMTYLKHVKTNKHAELKSKMNEKGVDLSKSEVIKEESKEEVQKESKEEESTRKRKLGTKKKMKSRKRRYIQNTSEDDSDKENDELRLHLTIILDEEKEVDYEILDRKYPIKE
ncbi:hypothetical protein Tco_1133120 [Tanacetum coccineum]|uniref:Uncharacterized protein n=1 Tax=Tanacetum coccineum TaxID=301880 RepID=A0ABQ5JHU3_9ASTR